MKKIFFFLVLFFFTVSIAFAQEITILFTGESHSMIYHCGCPIQPDGGLARRATLIKQIKAKEKNVLVLDAGAFLAGSTFDQYTQGIELDQKRALINIQAMKLMEYDAVNIGENEFNFGRKFFEDNIVNSGLNIVSSSLISNKIKPFVIKEVGGIKVGIIGITKMSVLEKTEGIGFNEPFRNIAQIIQFVRLQGVDIVIILSQMGENNDIELLKLATDADILITGGSRLKDEVFSKIGKTVVLRPTFQARRLGKAKFLIEDKKISNFKVEEIRVSKEIVDDKNVSKIVPICFGDYQCKKDGNVGICQNPGNINATCVFKPAVAVNLKVVLPKQCVTCVSEPVIDSLKKVLPGLKVEYKYYPSKDADELIKKYDIKTLPAFLLSQDADKQQAFEKNADKFENKAGIYFMKPEVGGVAYFIGRKNYKNKIDLFISLYQPKTSELLNNLEEFRPSLHFLAAYENGKLSATQGTQEVEEYLRGVCVNKYYPGYFWNYVTCRSKNIESSWWQDCLPGDYELEKIKACAQGQEGIDLLRENITLNGELGISKGPTYVLDNQEIFSSAQVPAKEAFRKIIKAKK